MPEVFTTSRQVEFRDTDAAGIAHFSTYFTFMEAAEHAFLRSLGLSVFTMHNNRRLSWPRVHASCDYRGAARFEDVLSVSLQIERLGSKSVTYLLNVSRDGQPLAEGRMTVVCCYLNHGGKPESTPIPAELVAKLTPYVMS